MAQVMGTQLEGIDPAMVMVNELLLRLEPVGEIA